MEMPEEEVTTVEKATVEKARPQDEETSRRPGYSPEESSRHERQNTDLVAKEVQTPPRVVPPTKVLLMHTSKLKRYR
uniref:Uncharacterized protein n=1 Tax=Brassica campestris TaxID=3711 RepID=M4DIN8_BRACM